MSLDCTAKLSIHCAESASTYHSRKGFDCERLREIQRSFEKFVARLRQKFIEKNGKSFGIGS